MRDEPDAAVLLAIARETFQRDIVPLLSAEHRYTAAMIANAMAIAAREAQDDGSDTARELALFRTLYAEDSAPRASNDAKEQLSAYNRRIVSDIRAGRFDVSNAKLVQAIVSHQINSRLRLSNPRAVRRP
jgi:hypothetical protein